MNLRKLFFNCVSDCATVKNATSKTTTLFIFIDGSLRLSIYRNENVVFTL